jgi:hypothetical protein
VQPFHDVAINALLRRDHAKAPDGFRHTIQIDPDWILGYIKRARSLALQKKCGEAVEQAGIAEHRFSPRLVADSILPLAANAGFRALLEKVAFPASAR